MARCADALLKPDSPDQQQVAFYFARVPVEEASLLLAQIDRRVAIFHTKRVRLETASVG
jgi:hypothetical protein